MSPHGTANRYRHWGCRCEECKAANSARCNRTRIRLHLRPDEDIPHGTSGGYVNWGCRCESCRTAHSAACRAQYLKRKQDAA